MTINPALINLQNPKLDSIRAEDVAGYRIIRSFFNKTLFNVHAVNVKGDLLVCVSADMDFDTASAGMLSRIGLFRLILEVMLFLCV